MKTLDQYQEELERNFRIAYLIGHFIQENLSEEEEVELENWIQLSEHNMQIFEDLTADATVDDFMKWYAERDTERNLREVKQRLQFYKPRKVNSFWRYAAAASIIILLGVGIYFMRFNDKRDPIAAKPDVQQDIAPGQYAATLTLANGQRIDLTKLKDTIINEQVHIENGAVIYSKAAVTPEYNELSIPRKGFYQLTLPDGSRAWINSSSSIRYPTRFTGNERRVSVTGETYFEVAKDALHPFIVSVNGTDVIDLGTAFNINAYPEEEGLKITLTEGLIKVSHANRQQQLKPGDQLVIHDDQWSLSAIDVSPIIAWTKNQFKLKNTTIEEVMRMASRWYDANIIYENKVTDHFTGTIDRSVPISELLKLLEATGQVHFRIEGDTIIVSH